MPLLSGLEFNGFLDIFHFFDCTSYMNLFFTKTLFFIVLFPTLVIAQNDGYWDKERATYKEIAVPARNRIVIKTEDLPEGTTELVFRITLLDANQQMASNLVSVLKAIPDPTGISQGSAGAVFLMSKISGEDKCQYAVFSTEASTKGYVEKGNVDLACLTQNSPVSKDAKRITIDKSTCLQSKSLWFGFESKNWIMNQKIVVEVVPWVNYKLSKGWTIANRKALLEQCSTSSMAQKMTNSDDFCVCILDKMQFKYNHSEFQKLLPEERNKAFRDFGKSCFGETSLANSIYDDLRKKSEQLDKVANYSAAIDKRLLIIKDGKATALDYYKIGTNYLFTKQLTKAIKYLKEGEKRDETELLIQLNLAHAYLLNNDYSTAKTIYKKYQDQNVTSTLSWAQKTKLDFDAFEKLGIHSDDFEKVLKFLKK